MRNLLFSLLLAATPATAQDSPVDAARAAVQSLEIAHALLDSAETRRDRVAALTATVQAYEAGLVAMRDGLRRAAIRERTLTTQLDAKREDIAQMLGVLQAMGRAPAPLLLLHPNGPLGTARGGMLAADVTPALQKKAQALEDQLQELIALNAVQQSALSSLADGLRSAQDARTRLSLAIAERTDLPLRFADDPTQVAVLLSNTDTLDSFADLLSDTFLSDSTNAGTTVATGDLPLPVQGTLLRGFNRPDAAGIVRPGVIIAAQPRAIVTTPVPATLLFRGPLLDYGNVVILEPAADVLFVVAGLAEVFGEPGQMLPAGDPIGLMGGTVTDVDAILNESGGAASPAATETLYLEVRDGQSPVNPDAWFALDDIGR